ncbi:hypothetical protein RRG08_012941 [Elysia crispata]|uniref:Uncharacterized protein n=1 Tax=Elysia crispata TaxID=231223 RepID=A0AAE1DQ79_9GAST|nr:hypothetical protein RRG08_012941 [Elysia crispata]
MSYLVRPVSTNCGRVWRRLPRFRWQTLLSDQETDRAVEQTGALKIADQSANLVASCLSPAQNAQSRKIVIGPNSIEGNREGVK